MKEYEDDDNQNGTYKVVLFANDDAAVRAFDLSFSGAYNSEWRTEVLRGRARRSAGVCGAAGSGLQ